MKGKKTSLFYRAAMFFYKQACVHRLPLFSSRQVESDLKQLHPGENIQWLKTDYYVKKLSMALTILLIGGLFGAAAKLVAGQSAILREDGSISRGSYSDGKLDIWVTAELEDSTQEFEIQLWPRQLSREETEELANRFREQLPDLITGKNENLNKVTEQLLLEDSYGDFPFLVEWESSRPDIVGSSGTVNLPNDSEQLELTAEFSYGEYVGEEVISVSVIPPLLTPEEKLHRELEDYLTATEKSGREEGEWKLPSQWKGNEIRWSQKVEDNSLPVWAAAMAVTVLVYLLSDRDLHERLEKRKRSLQHAYPDLVHQMVLFVGAGMTVRGAFQRVASDYEKKKADTEKTLPIYEEMTYTCRELQSGVSEGAAYEHFGRRTGQQEYIRLSTLLMQNLKRGNSALLDRLREEADKAAEERLQRTKRLGEEAGTKLLVPMVLMLAVVMVMIMVPAFLVM